MYDARMVELTRSSFSGRTLSACVIAMNVDVPASDQLFETRHPEGDAEQFQRHNLIVTALPEKCKDLRKQSNIENRSHRTKQNTIQTSPSGCQSAKYMLPSTTRTAATLGGVLLASHNMCTVLEQTRLHTRVSQISNWSASCHHRNAKRSSSSMWLQ